MSPILVRPVREQLEHDRIVRLLQIKYRRKHDAAINPGNEQNAALGAGPSAMSPDLVLQSSEKRHQLQGVVEVETGESVNHLEALSQWTHYGKVRGVFHLYVPASMVDVARRLCEDNQIRVTEMWSFHTVGDQVRFTLVERSRESPAPASRARASRPREAAPRGKKPAKAVKAVKPAKAVKAARPSKSSKTVSRSSKAVSRRKRK